MQCIVSADIDAILSTVDDTTFSELWFTSHSRQKSIYKVLGGLSKVLVENLASL